MFQNYIFDLYGTLIDIHTEEEKESLWEKMVYFYGFHGAYYTAKELMEEYKRLCFLEEDKHKGELHYELEITEVFHQLFLQKGVMVNRELAIYGGEFFRILSTEYIKLYDGVIELLEELKRNNKSLYVLSNAQRIFTAPELKLLNIEHYFKDIFLSSDFACKKPSHKFYEQLCKKHDLDIAQSIMIGNEPVADIMGAKEAGLKTLYIHSNLSPEIKMELPADYVIGNGDVKLIKAMIL